MDRHIETPVNRNTFFEFAGLVFDTGIVFENELEVGRRASFDEIDRDIYGTVVSLIIDSVETNIPFR